MARSSQLHEQHLRRLPVMTPILEERGYSGSGPDFPPRRDSINGRTPDEAAAAVAAAAVIHGEEEPGRNADDRQPHYLADVDSIVSSYLSAAERACGGPQRPLVTRLTTQCPCCKDVNAINNKKRTPTVGNGRLLDSPPLIPPFEDQYRPRPPNMSQTTPARDGHPPSVIPMVSDSTFLHNPEDPVDPARGFLNYPSTASLWAYLRTVDDHGLSPETCGKLTEDVMDASNKYTEAINKLDRMTQTKF